MSGQASDLIQMIDTFPRPMYVLARAAGYRCFPTKADFGYPAIKDLHYYGFNFGLQISRPGMIMHQPLLAARFRDIQSPDTMIDSIAEIVHADTGFIDKYWNSHLFGRHQILVSISASKNMKITLRKPLRQCSGRVGVDQIRMDDL